MCDINLDDICLPDEPFAQQLGNSSDPLEDSVNKISCERAATRQVSELDELPVPKFNSEKFFEPIKVKLNIRPALKPFSLGSSKTFGTKETDELVLPQIKQISKTASKSATNKAVERTKLAVVQKSSPAKKPINNLLEKAKKSLKSDFKSVGGPVEEYNPAEPLEDRDAASQHSKMDADLFSSPPGSIEKNSKNFDMNCTPKLEKSAKDEHIECHNVEDTKMDAHHVEGSVENLKVCTDEKFSTLNNGESIEVPTPPLSADGSAKKQLQTVTEPTINFYPKDRLVESYLNLRTKSTKHSPGDHSHKNRTSNDRESLKVKSDLSGKYEGEGRRNDRYHERGPCRERGRGQRPAERYEPDRNYGRRRDFDDRNDRWADRNRRSDHWQHSERGQFSRDRGFKRDFDDDDKNSSDRHRKFSHEHSHKHGKYDEDEKMGGDSMHGVDSQIRPQENLSADSGKLSLNDGDEPDRASGLISVELSADCQRLDKNGKICEEKIGKNCEFPAINELPTVEPVEKSCEYECELIEPEISDGPIVDIHGSSSFDGSPIDRTAEVPQAKRFAGVSEAPPHQSDPMGLVERLVLLTEDKEVLGVLALLKLLLRKKIGEGVFYKTNDSNCLVPKIVGCSADGGDYPAEDDDISVPNLAELQHLTNVATAQSSGVGVADRRRPAGGKSGAASKSRRSGGSSASRRRGSSPPPPPPKKSRGDVDAQVEEEAPPPPPRSALSTESSPVQHQLQHAPVAPYPSYYHHQTQQAMLVPVATYRPMFSQAAVQCLPPGGFGVPHQILAPAPLAQQPQQILYEQSLQPQKVTATSSTGSHDRRNRSIKNK